MLHRMKMLHRSLPSEKKHARFLNTVIYLDELLTFRRGSEEEIQINGGGGGGARRRIQSHSSLSLTPVQNKTHEAAQVWDHNCGGTLSAGSQ